MKEALTNILQTLGFAWWVELTTDSPRCTYYFGPFVSADEAESAKGGYIEDLEREGAQGIKVEIKRCKPTKLTVDDDKVEMNGRVAKPVLSN